jgi:hypothetical protein
MQGSLTRRPSPAIIVAVLALVAALAGTAIAGPNASTSAVSKKKVKKIATKQIKKLAPGLSVASATNADSAANSNALGGKPPGAFASSTSEPYRSIDTPGQPQFQNSWANFAGFDRMTAFYRDPLGIVHLRGGIITNDGDGGEVAFRLPPGYRPEEFGGTFPADRIQSETLLAQVSVGTSGDVTPVCEPGAGCAVTLNGITFRAGQ